MAWYKKLLLTLFVNGSIVNADESYPLAKHCFNSYEDARKAFIDAASQNKQVSIRDSIGIQAKGPKGLDLSIDIAVMGNLEKASKILFHISGTHGVEAGAGSGIQHEFLTNPVLLPEDTAIIFVHTLNPYGMAWNRRVNEDNIDFNRNCVERRLTPEFYSVIDPIFNPKKPQSLDIVALEEISAKYGKDQVRQTLLAGQYAYPEGLFYGGVELCESIVQVIDWCRLKLSRFNHEMSFGIIDVHTGLGPYGYDTLLTVAPPSQLMADFFGEKMDLAVQMASIGYKASGVFMEELSKHLQEVTGCSSSNIFGIGQEFGTIEESKVMDALVFENAQFQYAKRMGIEYHPDGPAGKEMLKAFYPAEKEWRHTVVSSGRALLLQSLDFLKHEFNSSHTASPALISRISLGNQ